MVIFTYNLKNKRIMKRSELVTLRIAQTLTVLLSTAFLVAAIYAIVQLSIGNVHPGAAREM